MPELIYPERDRKGAVVSNGQPRGRAADASPGSEAAGLPRVLSPREQTGLAHPSSSPRTSHMKEKLRLPGTLRGCPPAPPESIGERRGGRGRLNLGPRPHPRVCRVAPPGAWCLSGGGPTPRTLPVQEEPRQRRPARQLGLGRASDGPLSPGLAC